MIAICISSVVNSGMCSFFPHLALLVFQILWFRFLLFDFIFLPFRLIILRIGTALIVWPFVGVEVTVVLCEDVCTCLFPIPSSHFSRAIMKTFLVLDLLLAMCMIPLKTFRIFSICLCLFFFLFSLIHCLICLLMIFNWALSFLSKDQIVGLESGFGPQSCSGEGNHRAGHPSMDRLAFGSFDTSGFRPTRSTTCVRGWAEEPSWRGAAARHVRCWKLQRTLNWDNLRLVPNRFASSCPAARHIQNRPPLHASEGAHLRISSTQVRGTLASCFLPVSSPSEPHWCIRTLLLMKLTHSILASFFLCKMSRSFGTCVK